MEKLIEHSFKMDRKVRVNRLGNIYDIETLYPGSNNGRYYVVNGVMSFEYKDAQYVLPYSETAEDTLKDNGFVKTPLYVPFANYAYPVDRYDEYVNVFGKQAVAV